jgi:regulator of sigma E protease
MPGIVTTVLSVVVVLGIMILVHEWGHFVAAKAFGVRVEVFSIGFGPRLWGRRRGETDYRVSALPLGGYVKMAGDNPAEERTNAPDEFLSKPRWQRALIVLAGPVMNIVMAVVLVAGLLMVGLPHPAYEDNPAEVSGVMPASPAEQAGIRPGDRIVEISGVNDPTWGQVSLELQLAAVTSKVNMIIARDGERIPVVIPLKALFAPGGEFAAVGYPRETVIVDRVTPDMPADRAGVQAGDVIVAVNGSPLASRYQLADVLQRAKSQPMELTVRRGETELQLQLRPTFRDPGDGLVRWQIGIRYRDMTVVRSYGFAEAVARAVWINVRTTRQILHVVVQLFSGKVSIKQLEGPVGIARQSGQAAQMGPVAFFFLMAIISLNLGILNLLPIPILDGGHILLLGVEGTLRRDLSVTVKERFVQVGLVFLLVVFAIVMYNDVLKAIHR